MKHENHSNKHSSMEPWTESEGPVGGPAGLGALQEKGVVSALRSSQIKEKIIQKLLGSNKESCQSLS